MTERSLRLGRLGEAIALDALRARGYTVLEHNWRCAVGEIDLVAQQGDTLVIVEVRTRRGQSYGSPEESITPAKRARLIELGEAYVQEHGWEGPWRIDLVAVVFGVRGSLDRLTVIENAVEG